MESRPSGKQGYEMLHLTWSQELRHRLDFTDLGVFYFLPISFQGYSGQIISMASASVHLAKSICIADELNDRLNL